MGNKMNYEKRVEKWCLDNANYKIFKTLTGCISFSAIVMFSFRKHSKVIADNIMNKNVLLKKLMNK
jgi:hypothetical protein